MSDTRLLPYPEDGKRVESGPVKFGDDWAGVFLRGDDALAVALELDLVRKGGRWPQTANWITRLLLSCDEHQGRIAEREVLAVIEKGKP